MTTSLYLNQQGIAKIVHEPCHTIVGRNEHWKIYILPHMAWEPMRVLECFPTEEEAKQHFTKVYTLVELVTEHAFDALCRNLASLPRSFR